MFIKQERNQTNFCAKAMNATRFYKAPKNVQKAMGETEKIPKME